MLLLLLILLLFALIPTFLLGIFVFCKNRKNRINRTFSLFIFWATFWVLSVFLADFFKDPQKALFWTKMSIVGPAIFSPIILYFSWIFPLERKKVKLWKIITIFLPTLFFLIAWPTSLNIKEIHFESWGTDFRPGPLYYLLILLVFFSFGGAFVNFWKSYKVVAGTKKLQILYIFLAFFSGVSIGLFTNAILPLFGYAQLSSFGPAFAVMGLTSFVAYAITRYRLMDIRIVIKQSTVYLLSLLVVIGLAITGVWGISALTGLIVNRWLLVSGLIFGILIFDPIKGFFQKFANKYLFTSLYDYQEAVASLSQKLTESINLNEVVNSIVKITRDTMKLEKMAILLAGREESRWQTQKIIGFKEQNIFTLIKDIKQYFKKNERALIYDELDLGIENTQDDSLKKELLVLKKKLKMGAISILLPLLRERKLRGVIILGNKISRDAYSVGDLELLDILTDQAAIAIENAYLYKEVQDFTIHLQEKVEEQTKNIKKLFAIKNEFLHLVSHQLRTPLTALRGLVDLLNEQDYEQSPPEEKHKLKKRLLLSCERLANITNDMLNTLNLEQGKIKFKFEELDLKKIFQEILEIFTPRFQEKGLYLKLLEPTFKLPHLRGDPIYLPQAFQNIVDNALRYTQEGGLKISFSPPDSKHIMIHFQDTGIGITNKDKKYLFREKFFRGEMANHSYTAGTGLGLYMVRLIIEGHKGEVKVESLGRDQGSKFVITLPY